MIRSTGCHRLPAMLWLLLASMALAAAPAVASSRTRHARAESKLFTNPVIGRGQDPSITTYRHRYFLVQSGPLNTITIRRARSIKALAAAPKRVIWRGGEAGTPCCGWWAPELHMVDGGWYIYAAADDGTNADHRLQVLRSGSSSPLGPYRYVGELTTPGDLWSIDPSPLERPDGALFMFWSGWSDTENRVQNIYIASMSNPWTLVGSRVLLSTPQYAWERHPNPGKQPAFVNESPEPFLHGSTLSVTYSGSGCETPNYALGLLHAQLASDLLSPLSWTKSTVPILHSNLGAGIYGPGSNGWFASPSDGQTWIAFHAVRNPTGNCGGKRQVYAEPVRWNPDGTPNLGGMPRPTRARLKVPSGDPGLP
ncbi:MAG TPA: glycoside hydrolase family 43 protein [Solirubrobacteraceae bacterium]|nr:glycoside hydrolase family 43 protein [Solirubrobacteraceae bacterium]